MPSVAVYNVKGDQTGDMALSDTVFGVQVNQAVMHDAVVSYLASLRRGTHATKTRGLVSGGGRKPWRQKGTGRARQGSIRAPQWVGGGTVFGPMPRDYGYKLPRKMRRLALKSALSSKVAAGEMVVLDELTLAAPKTREFVAILNNLKLGKALFITSAENVNVELSARNLPNVKATDASELNVYDILAYDQLVMTKDAVAKVEEVLG